MAGNTPERATGALASLVSQSALAQGPLLVRKPIVSIGQGAQNDIALDDDTVSTRHAQLALAAGAWKLTDLSSKNGTYVDGARLEPNTATAVPDGASLRIGAVKLQFQAHPEADVEAARADYTPPEVKKPLAERSRPRLPVWLLFLIVIIIAMVLLLVLNLGGGTQAVSADFNTPSFEQLEWLNLLAA